MATESAAQNPENSNGSDFIDDFNSNDVAPLEMANNNEVTGNEEISLHGEIDSLTSKILATIWLELM